MAEHIVKYSVPTGFIAAIVLRFQPLAFVVAADDSPSDGGDSNQTDDDWCDDCDDDDDTNGNTTQIRVVLSVVGVFILTLLLLFLCYLRVRFMAGRSKVRRRMLRQTGSESSGNRVSAERSGLSVFALSVSSQTMGQVTTAFTGLRSASTDVPLGEVIIHPPAYSELDPITPPAPEYVEVAETESTIFGDLPPPYSSCLKEERNAEMWQTGSGEHNVAQGVNMNT